MLRENKRQEFIRRYAKLACNPDFWLLTARRLLACANILGAEITRRWDDVDFRKPQEQRYQIQDDLDVSDFQFVYMMLVGFALENLFKGHLIKIDKVSLNESMRKSGRMPEILKTHDLRELAGLSGIDITGELGNLLDRITKHSVWRGRYHFPLEFATFYHLTPKSDIPSSGVGYRSDDVEVIRKTIDSISQSLGFQTKRTGFA